MSTQPDLTSRPHDLTVERTLALPPGAVYRAWTEQIDRWFAAPGTVRMEPETSAPFFFATRYEGTLQPHYGRFLDLEPGRLVKLTWVTGAEGTKGAETVLTVGLAPAGGGTRVTLTHAGFPDEASRDRHEEAWPGVLDLLEERMAGE